MYYTINTDRNTHWSSDNIDRVIGHIAAYMYIYTFIDM